MLGDDYSLKLVLISFIAHGLVSSVEFKIGIVMVLNSTVFQTQRTMLMTATNKFNLSSEFVIHIPLNRSIMVGEFGGTDSGECTKQNSFSRQQSRRYDAVSEQWRA